ncbi:MAG: hypothetical protein GY941_17580 [Planctomycetes bacterium]|nr:hypothetical protein [Planctomycetota bacterium]
MRLSSREKSAIAVASLLLIAGIAASYWLCDAAWLGRFGALIIIVGVLFAFSDLPEQFEKSARRLIKLRTEFSIADAIEKLEDDDRSIMLTQEQKDIIRKLTTPSEDEVDKEAKRRTNRFYFVEVIIICVGTFTNGFGQWILERIW